MCIPNDLAILLWRSLAQLYKGTQDICCHIVVCNEEKIIGNKLYIFHREEANKYPSFTIIKNQNELIRPMYKDMNESKKCNIEQNKKGGESKLLKSMLYKIII